MTIALIRQIGKQAKRSTSTNTLVYTASSLEGSCSALSMPPSSFLNRTARTTYSMRGSSMRSYAIAMYRSEKAQKHGQLGRVEEVQEEHRHCS